MSGINLNNNLFGILSPEEKGDYIKDMSEAQKELCNKLVDFEFQDWILTFDEYIARYDRFFYSTISHFILSEEDDEQVASVIQNITVIISKVRKNKEIPDTERINPDSLSNSIIDISEKRYKLLLKFMDHCNLAEVQRNIYHITQTNIENKVDTLFYEEIKPQIDSYEKNITTQLISLVAIFTALSFVIFGSISILDNLLNNIKVLPLLKIIFIGDLWMLCMINIFAFFARIILMFIQRKWTLRVPVIIGNIILLITLIPIIVVYIITYGFKFVI